VSEISPFRKLIREIQRRSIWKVLGVYLAGSWVALQVVQTISASVGLPGWVQPFALVLVVLGLPVIMATAFIQEGVGARGAAEIEGPEAAGGGSEEQAGRRGAVAPGALSAAGGGPYRYFTWRNIILGGVGAFALWGIVAAGWLVLRQPGGELSSQVESAGAGADSSEERPSIAVLPFANRSIGEEGEYFTAGMHDDILTELSKIPQLKVISRTSVLQYRNTEKGMLQIGQELGVATVLEGAVERAGQRIRITVQLIDALTDTHLWAELYDELLTAENIFAIRSAVAEQIAHALEARLTPEVKARIESRPTESLAAYDLVVRGRYAYQTRGIVGEGLDEVIRIFEQAIALDSSFAEAWTGLANAYLSALNWKRLPAEEARSGARMAVARALALDPDLAEGHVVHTRMLSSERRYIEAERAVLRALELNPGLAAAYYQYSLLLETTGRHDEAVGSARRAVELDPLALPYRRGLSDRLYMAGQFDASIEESHKILEMSPGDWYARYNIGWSHALADRPGPALETYRLALASTTENAGDVLLGMAFAFAKAGQRDSALAYLKRGAPAEHSYDTALIYYELGDEDLAFSLLEQYLEGNTSIPGHFPIDPSMAKMRADPRYDALIRRQGMRLGRR
jgi:TolB-like protein/Tfp pilus assembly protein PilF